VGNLPTPRTQKEENCWSSRISERPDPTQTRPSLCFLTHLMPITHCAYTQLFRQARKMVKRRRIVPQELHLRFLLLLLLSFAATSVLAFLRHAVPRGIASTTRMATTTDSVSTTSRQTFPLLFPPSVRPTSLVFSDEHHQLWTFEQPFMTTTNIKSR